MTFKMREGNGSFYCLVLTIVTIRSPAWALALRLPIGAVFERMKFIILDQVEKVILPEVVPPRWLPQGPIRGRPPDHVVTSRPLEVGEIDVGNPAQDHLGQGPATRGRESFAAPSAVAPETCHILDRPIPRR